MRPGPRLARSTLSRVKNRALYEARTAAARAQFLVLALPAVDKLGAALDAWGLGKGQWFVHIADPGQLGDGAGATLPRPKEVALLKRTHVVHKYLMGLPSNDARAAATAVEFDLLTASCLLGVGSVLCDCVPGALLAGVPSPEWLGGWAAQGRPAAGFTFLHLLRVVYREYPFSRTTQ